MVRRSFSSRRQSDGHDSQIERELCGFVKIVAGISSLSFVISRAAKLSLFPPTLNVPLHFTLAHA